MIEAIILLVDRVEAVRSDEDTLSIARDNRGWPVPDAKTYLEVGGRLLTWAAKSKSPNARAQFALLASLYESVVERLASTDRQVVSARKIERSARRRPSKKGQFLPVRPQTH